jgi:NADH:ubiquinone oxidoreductase subunit H
LARLADTAWPTLVDIRNTALRSLVEGARKAKPLGGLLQPVADLFKLVFSELVLPRHTNRLLFAAAPVLLSFATTATPVAAGNANSQCRKNVSANAVNGAPPYSDSMYLRNS